MQVKRGNTEIDGPEAIGVIAITGFFVLFPLAGVVGATIAYMIGVSFPMWATSTLGVVMGIFAIAIWLMIIGAILGKIGGKG